MTRPYQSSTRDALAQSTRARIIAAGQELLLERGPARMTISDLAKAAQVSPQTIYNSVGSKADVVKAVYDVMLAGDADPTPMSERANFRAVTEADGQRSYASAYAAWTRQIYDRVGGLLGLILADGPAGDPALVDFLERIDRERRRGNANGLHGLASRGLLPENPSFDRIIDSVWVLTAPEVYDRLVRQSNWSAAEYEGWLANQLFAATTSP